jgi:hypothetical protein
MPPRPTVHYASVQHVLALLRLGNHDADVFFKFKQVLIDKVSFPYSTELVQHDVKDDVEKVGGSGSGWYWCWDFRGEFRGPPNPHVLFVM